MARYDALPASLPPRGLAREAAAQYVGISPTKFDTMIADGRMPRPVRIDGRAVWDIRALDAAFDVLHRPGPPAIPAKVIAHVIRVYSENIQDKESRRNLDGKPTRTISVSSNSATEEKAMRNKWKYVHRFKDRHGRFRNYFRRRGYPFAPLPDDQDSLEFLDAYRAALAGEAAPKPVLKKPCISAQSVEAVVGRCLASSRFLNSPQASRHQLAWILKKFRDEHAAEDFPSLQRADYKKMLAKFEKPYTKKAFLKGIRFLIKFLTDEEDMFEEDPTIGIKITIPKSDGYYTWGEDDIAVYRDKYPSGTRERRALELMLWLGPRRGDAIRLGPANIRNGKMHYTQRKTHLSLEPPIPPVLQIELDFVPKDQRTFMVDDSGKPFTERTFEKWFRKVCEDVEELPEKARAHGIRKAACRRLAEAECSAKQIQSISGHATLAQLEVYLKKADMKKLGESAQKKVSEVFS